MLEFDTRFGRHVNRRLRQEQIIWLTTVASQNTPQARPVWFHWDRQTVLIFSEKGKAKLRHIDRNPRVALNFNTDEEGGDVCRAYGRGSDCRRAAGGKQGKELSQKVHRRDQKFGNDG
jgi:PPOX class probable F420-dependent enzyme